MARQPISEYSAKKILHEYLSFGYEGIAISSETPEATLAQELENKLDQSKKYVLKIDQATKKRAKMGLLKLNISPNEILSARSELQAKGYDKFLLEEFIPHEKSAEKYLALSLTRKGYKFTYSSEGGVDIEDVGVLSEYEENVAKVANDLGLNVEFLTNILDCCYQNHFSYLEINPLVITEGDAAYGTDAKSEAGNTNDLTENIAILDLAVEVDTAAVNFNTTSWNENDYAYPPSDRLVQIENVKKLDLDSPASLKLILLEKNNGIWLLLSGGGASIVVADEVANLGHGEKLANYGEYSGNPSMEETYLYTRNLLELVLASEAKKKVIIIAGGVANFTDVRVTFRGIIKALSEFVPEIVAQNIEIFVRRGGPYQKEGLAELKEFLKKHNIKGEVHGPDLELQKIVNLAVERLD